MVGVGLSGHSGRVLVRRNRVGWTRAGIAALACASVVALAGCDLRLETDPVVFPSPDATTVARNSLADAEAVVLDAATDAGSSADSVAVGAAATAQAHLDALGGVYVAYPGATPSPSPSASPVPAPTLTEAINTVRTTAEEVAAKTADANLAFLARSIDLDWALRELWAARSAANAAAEAANAAALASASPAAVPSAVPSAGPSAAAESEPLPGDDGAAPFPLADGTAASAGSAGSAGFAPVASTGLSVEQLTALALAEDEARFAYETLAAQEFVQRRDEALSRSRLHAERSDALAAVLTVDLKGEDPRTPLYQLRDANLLDFDSRRALERSIETDLGARYAALLDGASAAEAAWLLNAAFDAYARAMATDGFATADLPTLPGLRLGAAATDSATPAPTPSA